MESDKEIEKLLEKMLSSSSNGEIDSVLTSPKIKGNLHERTNSDFGNGYAINAIKLLVA